ncbi:MAG: Hsp20/alpha crystallin family protein [Bacteroidia bacterium]|nr:Hsp20/alpha crystallin family protein [Bacteroidia bacterium]NNM15514.1 Hsp20/alpha crystallin family protein [Bacteroidia bacterium]
MTTLVKSNGNLFPDVPQFFDDVFARDMFNLPILNRISGDNLPAVNITESNKNYLLEFAVPGMKKNDFHIELDNNTLIVSAELQSEEEDTSNENYTRKEFSYKSFKRVFNLPKNMVEAEKISAKYEQGILQVTVPKTEIAKTKPVKQIQIS